MKYLYQWVQNLAYCLILMTAVQHILPGESYRNYIRFFSGLIMVLMLITPILDLFGMKGEVWQMYRREDALQMQKLEMLMEKYECGFGLSSFEEAKEEERR